MRKSAGAAVLVIAPLAAVSVAPEAKGQTTFMFTASGGSLSLTGTEGSFFSGLGTYNPAAYLTEGVKIQRGIRFISNGTSGGFSGGQLTIQLGEFASLSPDLPGGANVDFTYDFDLTLDAGLSLNSWQLRTDFKDSLFNPNGSITFASANTGITGKITGSGTFAAPALASSHYSVFLDINLNSSGDGISALLAMNGIQGVTLHTAAIPEPSTYATIIGLGALGFVIVRRTRRTRVA